MIVGLGLTMTLTASLVLGLLFWRDPAPAPAADAGEGALGALEETSRAVTIGSATMQLPDDPYAVRPDPLALEGVLAEAFIADAVIHPHYVGHWSWSAAVLVGRLPAVPDRDLEVEGRSTMERLSRSLFNGHPTRVTRVTVADAAVGGQPGVEVTARVAYAVEGLPSRFDVVTLRLVGLDDGSTVAAASSIPDDAPDALEQQAADALATLDVG